MPNPESLTAPNGWQAGAKALAQFQSHFHGVAKGSEVSGGPREGSKYANLTNVLAVAAKGHEWGLSHTGQARLVGDGLLVWREVLHHESGESVYTEFPIVIPDKGHYGQRQQDLGGGITYARKYCIQALYGLYADDGMDPDTVSYGEQAQAAPAKAKPMTVTVPKSQPKPTSNGNGVAPANKAPEGEPLSEDQKKLCMAILKDEDKGAERKKEFMAKFYPNAEKLYANMISDKKHLLFLDALQLNTPF